jgi:hypothetical protein
MRDMSHSFPDILFITVKDSKTAFHPGHADLFIIFLLILFLQLTFGCRGAGHDSPIFLDFESDGELDRLNWRCHALMTISDGHAAHGRRSLRLELYPSAYPGISPLIEDNNWQGYGTLAFDIYNAEDKELNIAVRIDDRDDAPDYKDRYNQGFKLVPGANQIKIPLNDLITSGTNRKLDLKKIRALIIFMINPSEKATLYVDYIRLEGIDPS